MTNKINAPDEMTDGQLDDANGGGATNMNKLVWDDALATVATDTGSASTSSGHYTQVVWADTR